MASTRRSLFFAASAIVVVFFAIAAGYVVLRPIAPPLTPAQQAAIAAEKAAHALLVKETSAVAKSLPLVNVVLPKRRGMPAPVAQTALFRHGMAAHEVWNFLPYYALGGVTQAELTSSSAVIFSGLCVASNGSIDASAGECAGDAAAFNSYAFSSFVASAHQLGTHVLLSLNAFSDATIGPLVARAASSAAALSATVLPLVRADGLDGVNIDIEGSNPKQAPAFAKFVRDFAHDMRVGDPAIELVLDSYAASASGHPNFFDVAALARSVDRIFAEAYQMDTPSHASANSPIASPTLGFSVVQTILQYEKVMPADKLVVGLPFYGLDFATKSAKAGSDATAPYPGTITYDDIVAAGHEALWDTSSMTPYTVFRTGGGWHQLWYDDSVSIALKVALAAHLRTAGVGAWALGMETNSPQLLDALDGPIPAKKLR